VDEKRIEESFDVLGPGLPEKRLIMPPKNEEASNLGVFIARPPKLGSSP
jgi:hypothetical protein